MPRLSPGDSIKRLLVSAATGPPSCSTSIQRSWSCVDCRRAPTSRGSASCPTPRRRRSPRTSRRDQSQQGQSRRAERALAVYPLRRRQRGMLRYAGRSARVDEPRRPTRTGCHCRRTQKVAAQNRRAARPRQRTPDPHRRQVHGCGHLERQDRQTRRPDPGVRAYPKPRGEGRGTFCSENSAK